MDLEGARRCHKLQCGTAGPGVWVALTLKEYGDALTLKEYGDSCSGTCKTETHRKAEAVIPQDRQDLGHLPNPGWCPVLASTIHQAPPVHHMHHRGANPKSTKKPPGTAEQLLHQLLFDA